MAGGVIVAEFLVCHGSVIVQGSAGATIVGDAGFGAHAGTGEHENLTRLEQARDTFGSVLLIVRGGVLGDNSLNGADRGTVHGGDFFALFTGCGEVLLVSPAVHSSPMLCAQYFNVLNTLNGCGAPSISRVPHSLFLMVSNWQTQPQAKPAEPIGSVQPAG